MHIAPFRYNSVRAAIQFGEQAEKIKSSRCKSLSKMFWMRRTGTGTEHALENVSVSSLDSSRWLLHPLTTDKLFLHDHRWIENKLLFHWWDLPGFPLKTSEHIRRRDATQKPIFPVMMIISEYLREILKIKASVVFLISSLKSRLGILLNDVVNHCV